jgi:5-methylcytosine-specific restriction endonuclease McrA
MKKGKIRPKGTKLNEWRIRAQSGEVRCSCGMDRNLTVDHIIPQQILFALGLFEEIYEDEENFEILCKLCNAQKGNKLDPKNPKTYSLLRKYTDLSEQWYGKLSASPNRV